MNENITDWMKGEGATAIPVGKARRKQIVDFGPRIKVLGSGENRGDEAVPQRRKKYKDLVPKQNDLARVAPRQKKNFVVINAVENILAAPKPKRKEERRYAEKYCYGKTPKYVKKFQQIAKQAAEQKKQSDTENKVRHRVANVVGDMPEEERNMLLHKLKVEWDRTNVKYQQFAHHSLLDTQGKIQMKAAFEKTLNELESGIEKLEKGPLIITLN